MMESKASKKLSSQEIEYMARERPYALSMIMMQIAYDQASLLEELVERLGRFQASWEETIPVGKFRPFTLAVTDAITELKPENTPTMPWIAFTIYNDGPDAVFLVVNEDFVQERTPLNSGENVTVNLTKRKVERVVLKCATGLTASVRIFAIK